MKNRAFDYDNSRYPNWIDPKDVTPYPRNAKLHPPEQIATIVNSITRFGWQQDVVLTADNVLVVGHGRRLAALEIGCMMPYHRVGKNADELTYAEIDALRLADNKVAESEWDMTLLEAQLAELEMDFDMTDFGFDDIQGGVSETETETVAEDDFDEDAPVESRAKLGDVFQLGRHRLMCGDSTDLDSVKKLMNGNHADMVLTDPPYNVNYEGGTEEHLTIQNDNMEDEAFREFLRSAFECADAVLKPGSAFYIWHADSEGYNFRGACRDVGWQVRQCLIWNKNSLVLGQKDYQWKHEPCLYGWKAGASHVWFSDRKQSTVLDYDKPLRSDIHPTMKPIKLFDYLIKNSCLSGGNVLDLFCGSGTTIMACEQDNRTAYCMEIDPKYVDATIARWEQFTGGKAVLIK